MTREAQHYSHSQPSHMLEGNARPHSPPEGAAAPSSCTDCVFYTTWASKIFLPLWGIAQGYTRGCVSFDGLQPDQNPCAAFQTFSSENHRGIGSRNANATSASASNVSVNIGFIVCCVGRGLSCVHLTRSFPQSSGKSRDGFCRTRTKLSLRRCLLMSAGSSGRTKRPPILQQSRIGTNAQQSDGLLVSLSRRSWSSCT